MDEIVERVENNFINIYNKFDILDKRLNDYHMKFDKINEIIDLIISDEYTKIYKTYIYVITRFVYVCFFCSLVKLIRSSYFLGILPCNFIQAVYKFVYTSLYTLYTLI